MTTLLSLRAMRALNVLLALWSALWIGLGVWTGYEVYALRTLSSTLGTTGRAVHTTGNALGTIGHIPFVGSTLGDLASQVEQAGSSAQASASSSRETIDQLAVLLGIAVGLIPTLPVLALYVPLRRQWTRDRRAVADAVRRWHGEPGLEDFLAHRALLTLSYAELREVAPDAWRALSDSARTRLAHEEMQRLGLERLPPP